MNVRHLLAVLASTMTMFANPAGAAEHDFAASGAAIRIVSPCARLVGIDPDPSLRGAVRVRASAAHPEEIAELAVAGERPDGVTVGLADRTRSCWRPAGSGDWSPTLALAIRVPPGMPVRIDEAGASRYAIGAVGGPLSARLSGAVALAAAGAAPLDLELSGSEDVRIDAARETARVRSSGDAAVQIGAASLSLLSLELTGAGRVTVDGGTVGALAVRASGAPTVAIGGTTTDAALSLSGAGAVAIARLTGALRKEVTGAADVRIGR